MKILPILFNTEMVKAMLDGTKTSTRRIVKGYVPENADFGYTAFTPPGTISCRGIFKTEGRGEGYGEKFIKLPYQRGDILYVRETWSDHYVPDENGRPNLEYCYKADGIDLQGECLPGETNRWYPSIHMPKEAARIWLKVTDVRVERLQDITIEDIQNEGISTIAGDTLTEWVLLWNSTVKKSEIGKYGWDANPYVWVIEFVRCEKPGGDVL